MKKLFTLLVVLFLTAMSFTQVAKVNGNKDTVAKNLANGYVEFVMPNETTADEVSKSAQYYTDYFTVEYALTTKIAKVKLLNNNDPMGRKVIMRFLLSTGVRTIQFANEDYTIMEFYSKYLE